MANGHKIIIEKFNLISLITFGNGLFFPMIFYIVTLVLFIISLIDCIIILFPLIFGIQVWNIEIGIMIALFITYLLLEYIMTRT